MGNFAEVLANNQTKNINKISDEIGKKLGTFNDSLIAYKANTNKAKAMAAATIRVNPKSTSRVNTCVETDGSSSSSIHDCQEEDTDTRKGKRKRVTDLKVNKK